MTMPRIRFIPTRQERRVVSEAAAYGMPQPAIAAMVGLRSEKTLRKHFRKELAGGDARANLKVVRSLFRSAIGGNVVAMMFWMKCRGGWRERPVSEPRHTALPLFIVSQEKSALEPENPSEEPQELFEKAPLQPPPEERGL
jgi:hypothetical protein